MIEWERRHKKRKKKKKKKKRKKKKKSWSYGRQARFWERRKIGGEQRLAE